MSTRTAGIYTGTLGHRRFVPRFHQFSYPLFMVMLDIDRIPEMMKVSRVASHNRFNWTSFYDRDHFGDPSKTLRERVETEASRNGIDLPGGPIFLLTHLRYLGYVFNPVSFFYCYDREGALRAVLVEVNNTFGESANYWLTGENQTRVASELTYYRSGKKLHVSPFMSMEIDYRFALSEPANDLTIHMSAIDQGERTFDATLKLEQREWSATNLRRVLLGHPLMTLKVILAIHWQAFILWLKNVPVFSNPTGRRWKVW